MTALARDGILPCLAGAGLVAERRALACHSITALPRSCAKARRAGKRRHITELKRSAICAGGALSCFRSAGDAT